MVADVKVGEVLTAENIRPIRPGVGMAPKHYEEVLGKKAARDLRRGEPLDWSMLA